MTYAPPVRRFDDKVIDIGDLTPGPQAEFHKLDPNVRYLWSLGKVIFWGVIFTGILIFGLISGFTGRFSAYLPLGTAALSGLAVLHIIWPFFSYPRWGYAIRRTDFLIRSGVIWRRVAAVPFNRIQHVDSNAGPIERSFGMANLVIHTAGSQMGSLVVPGLPAQHAENLRDYLSEVGHTHANI
ncbi:MAG: PH domain-containing protein [Acidobacteriota bacterium]|nr:PH domain-containing protein [Acidobacteriota bacterium]